MTKCLYSPAKKQTTGVFTQQRGDIWKLVVWWEGDLILEGCMPGCGLGGIAGKVGRHGPEAHKKSIRQTEQLQQHSTCSCIVIILLFFFFFSDVGSHHLLNRSCTFSITNIVTYYRCFTLSAAALKTNASQQDILFWGEQKASQPLFSLKL